MTRWFIIERCDRYAGWEQVPKTFSYKKEKQAEREMEKLSESTPHWAMRVHRAPKSHEPNPAPEE